MDGDRRRAGARPGDLRVDRPHPTDQGMGDTWTGCTTRDTTSPYYIIGCEDTSTAYGDTASRCGVIPVSPQTTPSATCGRVHRGGETVKGCTAYGGVLVARCAQISTYNPWSEGRNGETACLAGVGVAGVYVIAWCGESRYDFYPDRTDAFSGCKVDAPTVSQKCGLASSPKTSQSPPFPKMPPPERVTCGDVVVPLPASTAPAPASRRSLTLPRVR